MKLTEEQIIAGIEATWFLKYLKKEDNELIFIERDTYDDIYTYEFDIEECSDFVAFCKKLSYFMYTRGLNA